VGALVVLGLLVLAAPRAWAYRPFVSTDAAVADPRALIATAGLLKPDWVFVK
jgi:hypothetical protein